VSCSDVHVLHLTGLCELDDGVGIELPRGKLVLQERVLRGRDLLAVLNPLVVPEREYSP